MFVVGIIGWRVAHSTALLADAFDMLADASGYAVAHWAVGRSKRDQQTAARWNGAMLMALGLSIIGEVIHRWFIPQEPAGALIMGFAALSLVVNGSVLRMLSKYRARRTRTCARLGSTRGRMCSSTLACSSPERPSP